MDTPASKQALPADKVELLRKAEAMLDELTDDAGCTHEQAIVLAQLGEWIGSLRAADEPPAHIFPRADADARRGGWTLDQHMLTAIYKETRTDEYAPSEEGIEAVLLAYEKLYGAAVPPTESK